MSRKQVKIWLTALLFIAAILTATIVELVRSYRNEFRVAYTEADLSGYLVSEWISESFSGVEYVLKDALSGFGQDNIFSSSRSPRENATINGLLVKKASLHENIIFLGIFDASCVIQYGSIYSIIGDSSAELGREYCTEVLEEPVEEMKFSGFFISSTGEMNVSATYPLLGDEGEVLGFSLAALDLSFFQRWLDSVRNPAITISIMDANQVLLARKPESEKLGRYVEDEELAEFLEADAESVSFRRNSPVDGIDRLWSVRRIRDLPFVVAVGYALDDVLMPWYTKLASYAIGNALMITVTVFLALAYHRNSKNAETMEVLAKVDPLTGLMNRRSFGDVVRAKLEQATPQGKTVSFIMIDVDHFKKINDTLGHDAGDLILKRVAHKLTSSFRSSDTICRWGGEEFLVYLTDTDLDTAKGLAARLKAQLAEETFADDMSITVSQGISTWSSDDSFEAAIKRADEALFRAKSDGRNCYRT